MRVDMEASRLSSLATARSESLFAEDLALSVPRVSDRVAGARILVVGGAGSIGSATIGALIPFRPAQIVVVDSDENGLAELVRDLRGQSSHDGLPEIATLPVDYGSAVFHRMLAARPPFDLVFNFAALKHVRSEKDVCSVLQMLETNVIKMTRLLRWLGDSRHDYQVFSVSTDKAANPVNVMGASKRLMEQVMFSDLFRPGGRGRATSARFANVAFSNGSLLFGWLHRVAKRQPIPCPEATRRYFISLQEAGQICLLASTLGADRQVIVPDLDASRDLVELDMVARRFIAHCGFTPREYRDGEAAKANLESDVAAGRYPLLLTPLDTDGEKAFEEFVGDGEQATPIGLPHLKAVVPRRGPEAELRAVIEMIETAIADPGSAIDKASLVAALSLAVPSFRHAETGRTLDDRF